MTSVAVELCCKVPDSHLPTKPSPTGSNARETNTHNFYIVMDGVDSLTIAITALYEIVHWDARGPSVADRHGFEWQRGHCLHACTPP